ncbi:hypothetical protein KI387_038985, partial [Taxus chinensis]
MDFSFSRHGISKESRDSIRDKSQKHEASFLEAPTEVGGTGVLKEPGNPGNIEVSKNASNARENFLLKSSSSCSEERFV